MVAMLATGQAGQGAIPPMFKIEHFEQSIDIVNRLRKGESLFVDFEACDRAINFINGAICAIDGEYKRFSDSVYFYVGRFSE